MEINYFSKNGNILPVQEASMPISNIEYAYGYGVYETIRAANGVVYFLSNHIGRLLISAEIIGLEHPFKQTQIEQWVRELVEKNAIDACNIKIMLIGASNVDNVEIFIQCLPPLFPDRKMARDGASVITAHFERIFPHAKTLNMMRSYMAYRDAKKANCYDALLVNRDGEITEGTRTNFFAIRGKTLYTAPDERILLGVTRDNVIQVAKQNGYEVEIAAVVHVDLKLYDGAFLTSTSSKIMPIKKVDQFEFASIVEPIHSLQAHYDEFLKQ